MDLQPGDRANLSVPIPADLSEDDLVYIAVEGRGRRADLILEPKGGYRWKRLPVPWYHKVQTFITGRFKFIFEGTKIPTDPKDPGPPEHYLKR